MEPAAPSLTEEDLTEVKKDVSSTAGPGRAGGAGCVPAGDGSGNPAARPGPQPGSSARWEKRQVRAPREPSRHRGDLVEAVRPLVTCELAC